jgi:hypothetical protein
MIAKAVRIVRYELLGLFRNKLSLELTFHPKYEISAFDRNSPIFFYGYRPRKIRIFHQIYQKRRRIKAGLAKF